MDVMTEADLAEAMMREAMSITPGPGLRRGSHMPKADQPAPPKPPLTINNIRRYMSDRRGWTTAEIARAHGVSPRGLLDYVRQEGATMAALRVESCADPLRKQQIAKALALFDDPAVHLAAREVAEHIGGIDSNRAARILCDLRVLGLVVSDGTSTAKWRRA